MARERVGFAQAGAQRLKEEADSTKVAFLQVLEDMKALKAQMHQDEIRRRDREQQAEDARPRDRLELMTLRQAMLDTQTAAEARVEKKRKRAELR